MRGIRKIGWLSLLVAAALFVQNAVAGPVEFLPESSYYQGRTYYNNFTEEGFLRGRIDFAVYDTSSGNEFGYTAPGTGQFIYAYQIFCDTASTTALEYFSINDIGDNSIDDDDGIGSQDDGQGGLEPFNAFFNPSSEPEQAVWEFDEGVLVASEHSYFLVFTSDYDWKEGSYDVTPIGRVSPPTTGSEAPEPSTMLLLGLGGTLMFMRRRKSV